MTTPSNILFDHYGNLTTFDIMGDTVVPQKNFSYQRMVRDLNCIVNGGETPLTARSLITLADIAKKRSQHMRSGVEIDDLDVMCSILLHYYVH